MQVRYRLTDGSVKHGLRGTSTERRHIDNRYFRAACVLKMSGPEPSTIIISVFFRRGLMRGGAGFELGLEAGDEIYEAVLRLAFQHYSLREHAVADAVAGGDLPFSVTGPVERRVLARLARI